MDQPRSPPPYGPAGVELTQMPEPVPPPMVDMPVPIRKYMFQHIANFTKNNCV